MAENDFEEIFGDLNLVLIVFVANDALFMLLQRVLIRNAIFCSTFRFLKFIAISRIRPTALVDPKFQK